MEGVEFEKETYTRPVYIQQKPKKNWLTALVMKMSGGRIKTDEQASYVLLVVAVLFIIISIYKFSSNGHKSSSKEETDKIRQHMNEQLRSAANANQ